MVILGINSKDYLVFESFSEVTVKKGRELHKLSLSAPEEFLTLLKEQSKGSDVDEDQIKLHEDSLLEIQDKLDQFYFNVLECLSDIPKDIIDGIHKEDLRICFNIYLYKFVFGVLYYPLEKSEIENDFEIMGTTYSLPNNRTVMGFDRPFCDEPAGVFCDASDVDNSSRGSEGGKYQFAELLTAIMFREKGKEYSEDESLRVSEYYKDILTCDVYHTALSKLSEINTALKELFPNLYQKGNGKVKVASKQSGLADFGWMDSIRIVAETGVLNQSGLTPFDSVKKTNLYDVMTHLSNRRANTDFEKIYRENNK